MKTTRIFRVFSPLGAAVVLLALVAAAPLNAEFVCTQERMEGAWVNHAELFVQEREGMDIFPASGSFSSVAVVVFDEQGEATVTRQTNSTTTGVNRVDFIPAFHLQVAVNPDCTGRVLFTLRDLPPKHPLIAIFGFQNGDLVFGLDLVCADGQLECWATFTEPTAIFTGIVKFKRVEAFNAELEMKVDGLSAKTDAIMRRLGIPQIQ